MPFPGTPEDNTSQVHIPEQFFQRALFDIDDVNELRLSLYIYWRLDRMEGLFHYLRFSDLMLDKLLVKSLANEPGSARTALEAALVKAVERGTFLQAEVAHKGGQEKVICLNSPKGRALVESIQRGEWKLADRAQKPAEVYAEHPNIFQLYEANIGPLTPLIADALRDAEKTYQPGWIEDAFRIAVERNKRSWHYIEAILHRWQEGGRDDRKDQQNRRDTEEARRRYGEWEK